MNIVIYGPQGCGKTRNAEAIKQYFGADFVIDSDDLNRFTERPKLMHHRTASDDTNIADQHSEKVIVILTNDESKLHDYNWDQIKQLVPNLI